MLLADPREHRVESRVSLCKAARTEIQLYTDFIVNYFAMMMYNNNTHMDLDSRSATVSLYDSIKELSNAE